MADFKACVKGNLTKDPVIRTTKSGTRMMNFSVAVRTTSKNKDGEYLVNFVEVSVFGKNVDFLEHSLQKGTCVSVFGDESVTEYTDSNNVKRTSISVLANDVQCHARVRTDNNQNAKSPASKPMPEQEDGMPF